MTLEEIKALLLSGEEDGADRTAIYDQVMQEFSDHQTKHDETSTKLSETEAKVQELNDKLAKLTETNLKLLDKIKYVTSEPEGNDDEPDEPEVEIADLTSWYEEE